MSMFCTTVGRRVCVGGVVLMASAALAQSQVETATARDLVRLKQVELIQSSIEKNKGKPAESLYRAQLALATWDKLPNTRAARARAQATMAYVRDLDAYLKTAGAQVDGAWALDHVKFIIGTVADPIVNRMEYWGLCEHDRRELEPIARLLGQLSDAACTQINAAAEAAAKKLAEDPKAEKDYMARYALQQEAAYYQAWTNEVRALAAKTDQRAKLLAEVVAPLAKWADASEEEQATSVRFSALLLRGKAHVLAGDLAGARSDMTAASAGQSPLWVQYQARYQLAVAPLMAREWASARQEAAAFKNWVDSTPQVASAQTRVAADLLTYRAERAAALASLPAAATRDVRERSLAKSEEIVRQILRKQPQFRDMVWEMIATAADDESGARTDLENLGVAWSKLIRPALWLTDDAQLNEWRAGLAAAQAATVGGNRMQLPMEKAESTLLIAIAYGKLGQWLPAAKANVDFADTFPGDARAPDAAQLALAQLAEFRKAAANAPEVQQLTLRALSVAIDKLGQKQWMYAKGVALEDMKQRAQAIAMYEAIAPSDEHYLDARYRLLRMAVDELTDLQTSRAPIDKQKAAAKALINHCEEYLAKVEKLPAAAAQRQYVPDIWLIEIGVNLNPLEQPEPALTRLAELEKRAAQLPPATMGAVLRYKVQAYQLQGNSEKAAAAVREFAGKFPQEGPEFIRLMVAQQTQEIAKLEKSDPPKASTLAAGVTGLLDPLITMTQADEAKKKDAYTYRQLKADMLARAGRGAESQKLWNELQQERPGDLYNFLGEARAMFVTKQYDVARDLFARILPKVPVGSESYWECYLRIIQSDEARGKPVDARRLRDLKVMFGDAAGGKEFKEDFAAIFKKYGAE